MHREKSFKPTTRYKKKYIYLPVQSFFDIIILRAKQETFSFFFFLNDRIKKNEDLAAFSWLISPFGEDDVVRKTQKLEGM